MYPLRLLSSVAIAPSPEHVPLPSCRRLYRVVFLIHFTMFNPYIAHISEQTGMSESEVRESATPATLTLADANRYGFESIEEYEEAIREYVYG